MKLHVKERFLIPQLLNSAGSPKLNFKQYAAKKEFLKQVELTEKDKHFYEFVFDKETESFKWNVKTDQNNPIEITVSQDMKDVIVLICETIVDPEAQNDDNYWQIVEKLYDL